MFRNYLSAALRNLSRNGLYAGITIAGLAIGFSAAIIIGLYVRHELTYDRFVAGHERVFLINMRETFTGKAIDSDYTPSGLADQLKLDFPQIQYVARLQGTGFPPAVRHGQFNIGEQNFVWADPDFFKVMPVPAIAGNLATALEAPDAVVLSRSGARKYFGRDAPVGETLQVDGHPMRVAAVIEDLPSNSHLKGDVFGSGLAPFSTIKQLGGGGPLSNIVDTYVRLKPGASAAAFDAALPQFVTQRLMPAINNEAPDEHVHLSLRLKPLTSIHLEQADQGDLKPAADVKVLAGIAVIGVLIVVVAAINFVTLMTARAARRAVEVGVRKALGAERKDLVTQFMGEALLYVAVALVLAIAFAEVALPAVNAALQRKMSFDYMSDPMLLTAMLGVAGLVGVLAGVYPALVLSAFRPASVLKGGPIETGGGGRVRQILVVTQFAVLIVLLFFTLTIYRQTAFALRDATHTNKDQVVMYFASPCTDAFRDAVRALPGVRGAACSSPFAIGFGTTADDVTTSGRRLLSDEAAVDFGFFEVYGVQPIAGRVFSVDHPGDDGANLKDSAPPIVINQAEARALGFSSPQAAIGHIVNWHFDPAYAVRNLVPNLPYRPSEIVGVVPDFTFDSIRKVIPPTFYYIGNKRDLASSVALNVKLDSASVAQTLPAIDKVWDRISGGLPVQRFFADQFLLRLYIDTVLQGAFIAVLALIAVSIACLGLFALSAYTAERRTKEIGVRKAMGASSTDILKLLLWEFSWPVLLANVIAWPLGFAVMGWWLSGFAYRVDLAPWTFVAAGAAAVVIALATVFAHGLRVARAKPVAALRYE
ncbi:MAG: FtsX-like permease family protein [Caulobacterales bacterium]